LYIFQALSDVFSEKIHLSNYSDLDVLFKDKLADLRQLIKSIKDKLHEFVDLNLGAVEVFDWKAKERGLLDSKFKAVK
jgi:hypothetical protein